MAKVIGWGIPKSKRSKAPFYTKNQIVTVFDQVAILLELDGANVFRVRAYQNASRALGQLEKDLFDLVSEDLLIQTKGIGKGLASLVKDIVMEGHWENWGNSTTKSLLGSLRWGDTGLGPKRPGHCSRS